MKTTASAICFSLFLHFLCHAQDFVFSAGTNTIHLVFTDPSASAEAKELFLSDFKAAYQANKNGLSVETDIEYLTNPPYTVHTGWTTNTWLYGIPTQSIMRERASFPTTLVHTNGIWLLSVSKDYTDPYDKIHAFAVAHAAELEKLKKFIAEDLAAERIASISEDEIYAMTLDKQWKPGDKNGPYNEELEMPPPAMRAIYYPPVIAGVLEEKVGPDDGQKHLFAQLNARWNGPENPMFDDRVFELWAVYWRDKWWLTFWNLEEGAGIEQTWTPSEL